MVVLSDSVQAVPALPAAVGVRLRIDSAATAWRDYVTLTKPRIMSLLVLTAVCAMVAAAGGAPAGTALTALVIGGGLACGGACALNHVIDRGVPRPRRGPQSRGAGGVGGVLGHGARTLAPTYICPA